MPGTFAYDAGTNTVTVTGGTSGSPADFASFVTADRANSASLLAAWSPNNNTKALTYQVRPVELLALLISLVVAGKTAETDYIFITGTDAWGNAQTESMDVSAGNGTYVSSKRFRTITNIDCSDNPAGGGTVWADGTVAVTQPIWGVIWNKSNRQYQIDCFMQVGDGSTSTYFRTILEQINTGYGFIITGTPNVILIKANATMQWGVLEDAVKKTTSQGSVFYTISDYYHYIINNQGGTLYLYSSYFASPISGAADNIANATRAYNTTFGYRVRLLNSLATPDISNLIIQKSNRELDWSGFSGTARGVNLTDCSGGIYIYNMRGTFIECIFTNVGSPTLSPQASNENSYFIDCDLGTVTITWYGTNTGKIYMQHTFNLHLTDKDDNDISGATVTLKDNTGATAFSAITGADGKITQQIVTRGYYDQAHGSTLQDLGPHTLTITADGYQDYQDVITIDRKMDLEVALLGAVAPGGGVSPTNLGLVPLGIKQVAV